MIPSPSAYLDWRRWAEALYKHFATQREQSAVLLPIYAKAKLPPPTRGFMIYVTDDVGGAVPAFSDGADWRRVTDRAVVS